MGLLYRSLGFRVDIWCSVDQPPKNSRKGDSRVLGLSVVVSVSLLVFNHCLLSFHFLRVCFVFIPRV